MSNPQATTAPLNDVMLAMDVVDTLRHRQDLVARELDADAREKQLIEKLRNIYHQQGIEVTDAILREGVAALAESRFVYTPPAPGFMTSLARLYVSRARWGKGALAFLLVVVLGLGGYYLGYKPFISAQREAARIELAETMPAQMDALYRSIYEETKVQQAVVEADQMLKRGKAAASEGERAGAQAAIDDLVALRDLLRERFALQIVSREGVLSAVWRVPDSNPEAKNYYLVVEAIDPEGGVVSLPITNEETGQRETVSTWGVRVPESVYRAVEADQRDDGIIQQNQIGLKDEGYLDVQYFVPVLGGAITKW